ncbi:MAG: pentapeptide repeat-containing protein [Chlamydiota bacterium]
MFEIDGRIYKKQNFLGGEFSQAVVSDCTFENCLFENCDFCHSNFNNCFFKNCNVLIPQLDGCRLQDVSFDTCKISGGDFYKCDKRFFSLNFENCLIQSANFSELLLKGAIFRKCNIKECYFNQANLVQANFSDSNLMGTLFHHSNLSKADFRGAYNYSIDPQLNTLKKAYFSLPEAISLLASLDLQIF